LVLLVIIAMGLTSCFARQPGRSGRNERGMSPGPPGGLIDRDYRIPLLWINEPGQYGPGEYGRWLEFGGRERYYLVHVPPQYKQGVPTPVVLALHGGGGNPDVIRFETGLDNTSNLNGFIVVYPAATSPVFTDRLLFWNAGATPKNRRQRSVDDVAFIAAVLDDLAEYFSIDPQRVYATGLSNGAHMCYLLAARLSDRIAAIAPVAGQRAVGQYAPVPPRPVPVVHFHGRQDTWMPFAGGESNPDRSGFEQFAIAPVMEAIGSWVAHNGCPVEPQESRVGQARCLSYTPCRDHADVVLWVLENGGHTWPGGRVTKTEQRGGVGRINTDISASNEIWKFFQDHPKP
jgi:polyhydroxybutyrate depolymerase